MKRKYLEWASLFIICVSVFVFLISVSKYPAGDDPGYHSSVLKYLLIHENTDFVLPFFPQVHTIFNNQRFVTNIILLVIAKITGIQDVFVLTIYFAAFCMSASLIFLYLFISKWLRSPGIALFSIIFFGFSKWFQASFWEGSYDQYTGFLVLMAIFYLLYRWYADKKFVFFLCASFFLAILYKTHELGFLIGLSFWIVLVLFHLKKKLRPVLYYLFAIILFSTLGLLYYATQSGYFTITNISYLVPQLLHTSQGISYLAFSVIIFGFFIFVFVRKDIFVFSWLSITFIFSQSSLVSLPFYPYRFNLYFFSALVLLYAVVLHVIYRALCASKIRFSIVAAFLFLFSFYFIFPKEILYIYSLGKWITGQDNNPSSVILKEDIAAFEWIKSNTRQDALFLAPYKWGYYLPAIAERSVVLDNAIGGDERDNRWSLAKTGTEIFTSKSSEIARQKAKDVGIRYVVWDASISRFPDRYPEYRRYKFEASDDFLKVYDKDNVQIYEVQ